MVAARHVRTHRRRGVRVRTRVRRRAGPRGGIARCGDSGIRRARGVHCAPTGRSQRARRRARSPHRARRGDDRHRSCRTDAGCDDSSTGTRVPSGTGPRRAGDRPCRPRRRRHRCRWQRSRRCHPHHRRRGVHRRSDRRDAARALVPRPARSAPRTAERAGSSDPVYVAVRGRRPAAADGHAQRDLRVGVRRLGRHARLLLDRVRGHDGRVVRRDATGAARALLLGRDGGDGPALPRDPDRVRHRSRRTRGRQGAHSKSEAMVVARREGLVDGA